MSDREFFQWLHDRLVHHHGVNPLVDYMHRLREIIEAAPNARMRDLPQEYYGGRPGEYFCKCIHCESNFLGDKRDGTCPKCRNAGRIASANRDAEGWVLFSADRCVVEGWPSDWPKVVDAKFLKDRGIRIFPELSA